MWDITRHHKGVLCSPKRVARLAVAKHESKRQIEATSPHLKRPKAHVPCCDANAAVPAPLYLFMCILALDKCGASLYLTSRIYTHTPRFTLYSVRHESSIVTDGRERRLSRVSTGGARSSFLELMMESAVWSVCDNIQRRVRPDGAATYALENAVFMNGSPTKMAKLGGTKERLSVSRKRSGSDLPCRSGRRNWVDRRLGDYRQGHERHLHSRRAWRQQRIVDRKGGSDGSVCSSSDTFEAPRGRRNGRIELVTRLPIAGNVEAKTAGDFKQTVARDKKRKRSLAIEVSEDDSPGVRLLMVRSRPGEEPGRRARRDAIAGVIQQRDIKWFTRVCPEIFFVGE